MTSSAAQSLTITTTLPPPFVHAVGGALGGAIALILLYPLERIRIEMQRQLKVQPRNVKDCEVTEDDVETIIFTSSPIKRPQPPSSSSDDVFIGESWSFETVNRDGDNDTNENFQDALSEMKQEDTEPPPHKSQQQPPEIILCFRSLLQRNELYGGITPVVTTLAVSNFIFFYTNEWFKNLLQQRQSSSPATRVAVRTAKSRYLSLLASCLAGICNVLITNPLWVTNLRITTGDAKYRYLISEMIHTIRQHDNTVQHLWSGTIASLLLVSNPVIQFFVYEELQSWKLGNCSKQQGRAIAPIRAFVIGAIAKTIATLLTYPIQVAQSLLRMQEKMNDKKQPHERHDDSANASDNPSAQYRGTTDCLQQLYQQNGILSLYTGIRPKLLQTVLTAAVTFVSYEQIVHALHRLLLSCNSKKIVM